MRALACLRVRALALVREVISDVVVVKGLSTPKAWASSRGQGDSQSPQRERLIIRFSFPSGKVFFVPSSEEGAGDGCYSAYLRKVNR